MLRELRIENFILIDELHLVFSEQLNVFSGETGAGKSMIIGALNAGLGEKVNADVIRKGAEKAVIQLIFEIEDALTIERLESIGIDLEEGLLIITREVFESNRSSVRANGRIITMGMLRDMSDFLMDIHGQHAHQALLYAKNHLMYLDLMGNKEHQELIERVQGHYQAIKQMKRELDELASQDSQNDPDYLQYQIDEIDAIGLSEDDDEALSKRFEYFKHLESIHTNVTQVQSGLSSEDDSFSVKDIISKSIQLLREVASFDETLEGIHESMHSVMYEIESINTELRNYLEDMNVDASEMKTVEDRMNAVNTLKMKHGNRVEDILKKRDSLAEQLDLIKTSEKRIQELEQSLLNTKREYVHDAKLLHQSRLTIKEEFVKHVQAELVLLNMDKAKFDVRFIDSKLDEGEYRLSANGFDQVEYMIATNPGMPIGPLTKIASGGEISRIMLAIKIALSHNDMVTTLVFDEVDTGISGQTAKVVGEKIHQITSNYQVICITHLPQIAVMADKHFVIDKNDQVDLTTTTVVAVKDEKQLSEIARMLSGDSESEISLQNAEEMLNQAQHLKSIS